MRQLLNTIKNKIIILSGDPNSINSEIIYKCWKKLPSEIKRKIYTSSLDALTDTPFSSSFEPAEFQSMAYESNLFRLFYKGQLLTKDNTIDGKDPVEITITSPTKLVTQEPGESKLKVE